MAYWTNTIAMKYQRFSLINEWDDESVARWNKMRDAGYSWFVLKMGMGFVGLPFFLVLALFTLSLGDQNSAGTLLPPISRLFVLLVVSVSVGWTWSYFVWLGTEASYTDYLELSDE